MHLKACVTRLWKPRCSLDIYTRENGNFFFKFGSKDECNRVLQAGPWLFDGRLIIIKHCSPDSGLERDVLTSAPVWIRFPALHLKYWSQTILSKIASLVGVPLYMDKATTQFERLAYARSFVEISAKNHLPKCVHLEIEGGRQSQN